MNQVFEKGIVRFYNQSSRTVGAGFLVEDRNGNRLIITCAHVVNAALNRNSNSAEKPILDDLVKFDFPFTSSTSTLNAKVHVWNPKQLKRLKDIAILRTDDSIPKEVT